MKRGSRWALPVLALCLTAVLTGAAAAGGTGAIESLTCRTEDGQITAAAVCTAKKDAVLVCGAYGGDGILLAARSAEADGGGEKRTVSLSFPAELEGVAEVRGYLLDRATGRPLCAPVSGENTARVGDFLVTGGFAGTDYIFEQEILAVLSDRPVTIRNADPEQASAQMIAVVSGVDADVTLAGVEIDREAETGPAFLIADGSDGDVTVTLAAGTENILRAGYKGAGLQKSGTAGTLTLRGDGSLLALGDTGGAGIGGGQWASASGIRIEGGTIQTLGSDGGAGIGGGYRGNGTDITITGGTVTARGSDPERISLITIHGRTYASPAGRGGAGIGGGYDGGGVRITITGGTVTACGAYGGAGIGGGQFNTGNPASKAVRGDRSRGADITITGGTVTARGGSKAAGIGGGCCGDGEDITITGGLVDAGGGSTQSKTVLGRNAGAGIGGGAYGGANYGDGAGRRITITGGTVTAVGGIDRDSYGQDSNGAAGIGGGWFGPGEEITVSGGTVTATGRGGGAGIGGGFFKSGTSLTLSGGAVLARGGPAGMNGAWAGAAVGNGAVSASGEKTYVSGEEADAGETGGAVFRNGTLDRSLTSVKQAVTLPAGELTVGADQTLIVEAGASVTIPDGGSLRNDGTILYRAEPCPVTPAEAVIGNPPQFDPGA